MTLLKPYFEKKLGETISKTFRMNGLQREVYFYEVIWVTEEKVCLSVTCREERDTAMSTNSSTSLLGEIEVFIKTERSLAFVLESAVKGLKPEFYKEYILQ